MWQEAKPLKRNLPVHPRIRVGSDKIRRDLSYTVGPERQMLEAGESICRDDRGGMRTWFKAQALPFRKEMTQLLPIAMVSNIKQII